jgi:uncharacterized protein with GYD domain
MGLWYAFGPVDGYALIEPPDLKTGAGLAVKIGSSGSFAKFETTPLLSQAETLEALEFAGTVGYVSPAAGATV